MSTPLESTSALQFDQWVEANNPGYSGNRYGAANAINNFFTGENDRLRENYQTYLDNLNRQFELDKINSAREWEEYMDSSKYQRMVKDMEAAGLNPALLLSSGIGASGQPSSPSGAVSAKYESHQQKKDNSGAQWLSSAAMVIMAIAKIAAILA